MDFCSLFALIYVIGICIVSDYLIVSPQKYDTIMRIRTIAILLTGLFCLGLTACQEILFAKKAKGRNPLELVGDYYFSMQEGTKDEASGLLEFKHIGNSQYEIEVISINPDLFGYIE